MPPGGIATTNISPIYRQEGAAQSLGNDQGSHKRKRNQVDPKRRPSSAFEGPGGYGGQRAPTQSGQPSLGIARGRRGEASWRRLRMGADHSLTGLHFAAGLDHVCGLSHTGWQAGLP